MGKNKKRRNAEGGSKKINKPNPKMKETKRHSDLQRIQMFNNKKAEQQQSKDFAARQAALDKMGLPAEQQQFSYEDHREIYNYAQERAPIISPPSKQSTHLSQLPKLLRTPRLA